jgi:hypothetical protein
VGVQAEIGLTLGGVLSVAGEALVRQDRPDIPVEFNGLFGWGGIAREKAATEQQADTIEGNKDSMFHRGYTSEAIISER